MAVQHDRTIEHSGTQDATTVTISAAIGSHPIGTTVQAVLVDFAYRLTSLAARGHPFTLDATFKKTTSATLTLDALLVATQRSFTLDAIVRKVTTFTLDAFVV